MKKALSILLTAALLLTCLAGCGGAGSASPSGTDTSGTSQSTAGANVPALKGPGNVTLKRLGYNVAWDPTTDIMVDVLKETTGYDVEYYALPAENADEKLVMEVAGGASYDIIQCSPDQFQTLMSQGALMPLNDLLDVYGQDILNGVSEDSWRAVSGEDGNIYGIPYKYPYAQEVQGFMVCRWDLMQEAGIEAIPTTIDEFYDCLVKLKEHFGDQYIIFSGPYRSASEGNGTWIFPQAIAAAFGIYNDWMVDEDGNVYYMTEHENFGKMIEFLSKCQQEGLLDPDWAVNTSSTVQEKLAGGKAIIAQINRNGLGETTPTMLETLGLTYDDLGYIGALKGSDGTCKYMRTEAAHPAPQLKDPVNRVLRTDDIVRGLVQLLCTRRVRRDLPFINGVRVREPVGVQLFQRRAFQRRVHALPVQPGKPPADAPFVDVLRFRYLLKM